MRNYSSAIASAASIITIAAMITTGAHAQGNRPATAAQQQVTKPQANNPRSNPLATLESLSRQIDGVPSAQVFAQERTTHGLVPSNAAAAKGSPQENFATELETFRGQLEEIGKNITDVTTTLNNAATLTPESARRDVNKLREQLLNVDTMMGADAPFPQAIDRLENWLTAQKARVSNNRGVFPSQKDAENILQEYAKIQEKVSAARELLAARQKAVVNSLTKLAASETLATEYVLIGQAKKAVAALGGLLDAVGVVLDNIDTKLRNLQLNGPTS